MLGEDAIVMKMSTPSSASCCGSGCSPFAFAFALLGYGAATIGTELSVSADTGEASAEVVDVQQAFRAPDTITVEFEVADKLVRADIEDDGYHIGDRVTVQYDRAHPTRARIKGSHGQLSAGVLFGGFGLVFTYAVVNPRWAFRKRR